MADRNAENSEPRMPDLQLDAEASANLRAILDENPFGNWLEERIVALLATGEARKDAFWTHDDMRASWEAGVASRQGEVDRLKAELQQRREEEAELIGVLHQRRLRGEIRG